MASEWNMTTSRQKVLVIGLDGASPHLIESWASEGKLPNFKKILENGASGGLGSVIPPYTPPAWTSFMTGKNPGKHGIFGFTGRDTGIVNASYLDGKTLWRILSDHGKKVIVINVPMTFPVERINGVLVSGYMAPPDDLYTYPQNLKEELENKFPSYRVYMNVNDPICGDEKAIDSWLKDLYSITEQNLEVTTYFMKNFEWDFLMTVFMGTDWIAHVFWRYEDPACVGYDIEIAKKYKGTILRYYQEIDSILKKILDQTDEETMVVIMSDHGSGPFHQVLFLDEWLIKVGLLKLKDKDPWNVGFWLSKMGISLEKVITFVSTHQKLLGLGRWIWSSFRLESSVVSNADWSKTRAYPAQGGIYINVKGRESHGIVEPGKDYEEIRELLIQRLMACRDTKSGEKVFDRIFKKEELYSGPHLGDAPDLAFVAEGPYLVSRGLLTPRQIVRFAKNFLPEILQSSKHEIEGTLLVMGGDVRKNTKIRNASIIDLAPTILYVLGIPIPSDMDGRPLKELFEPSSHLAKTSVQYQAAEVGRKRKYHLTQEENEEIKRRLRVLGYLD